MRFCLRTETERKTRLYISQHCNVHHVKLANCFPLRLVDKLDKLSGIVSELVKDFWERLHARVLLINSPFAQKEDFRKIKIDHVFTVYLPLHLSYS